MVANSFLSGIKGDSTDSNHRAALVGNAMVFNLTRWVRLTAGVDSVPDLRFDTNYTAIISLSFDTLLADSGLSRRIFSQSNDSATGQNRLESLAVFNSGIFTTQTFSNSVAFNPNGRNFESYNAPIALNKPYMLFWRKKAGTMNVNSLTSDLFFQGRKQAITSGVQSSQNYTALNYIDIGRVNGLSYFVGRLEAKMRSFELFTRQLNDVELRKVFNYGTAHAAGLITASDISIDFNRINGQAPICRTGSRQLTVTPYNNTTSDTAGTTYTPFL